MPPIIRYSRRLLRLVINIDITKVVNIAIYCGLLAFAAANGGCRRGVSWETAPIEGTVSQAGRPIAGVRVIFWPEREAGASERPAASGLTDAAGRYELRTDAGDRGAVVGRHRVGLLDAWSEKLSPQAFGKNGGWIGNPRGIPQNRAADPSTTDSSKLPRKYRFYRNTPLRVEVQAGRMQTFDFDVPDGDARRNRDQL